MGTTARGLTVSTDDADAIAALDDHTLRLARILPGADGVLAAAEAHPGVVALQTAAAMLFLYGQTADADAAATTWLAAADAAADRTANEHERAVLAAAHRWHHGAFLATRDALEAVVARWPRDLLALKALEFVYYVLGQQHNGPRFLATVEGVAPANPDDADVLAVWSFAAELSDDEVRAADLAEQALAIEPHTPWAHHALAHVWITQGDPAPAVDRLSGFRSVWETSGRVVQCHNAWHLAVALLDRLEVDASIGVFDELVWGVAPDTPGEQIDAISLLWRLEMAGEPVDDARWADVADHVEARLDECVFPFLSAHHAYALARAGRTEATTALLARVAERAGQADDEATTIWRPIGEPVVRACAAHGRGDLAGAAALLEPVMGSFTAIGGSDAQDDLFRLAYLTALVGSGRGADARSWWTTMTAFKSPSPLDERLEERLDAI